MKIKQFFIILCGFLVSGLGFAAQDDVADILRKPDHFFYGNEEGRVNFLSAYGLRAGFGEYLYTSELPGQDFHGHQFKAGVDYSALSFGKDALLFVSYTMEGLADRHGENGFWFRMIQTYYDLLVTSQWRLGKGTLSAGYRHRCRHSADKIKEVDRIIMRTGPEVSYSHLFELQPVNIIWANTLNIYLVSQNPDFKHQPRFLASSVAQADWTFHPIFNLFASAGLGASFITQGATRDALLFDPLLGWEFQFTPVAALGVALKGKLGDFKLFLNYHANLDTGHRDRAARVQLLALNGEFWF